MKLYEIPGELENLLSQEEIDFDAVSELAKTETEKLESIGLWVKNLEANAAAMKIEVKNLQNRITTAENKSHSLKDYLRGYLLSNNRKTFESPKIKLSFRKSEIVEIYNEEKIPNDYKSEVLTVKVDKKMLKEAIKGGANFNGVALIEKQNLQIK